jgi:uncharacterized protein YutD
MGFTSEGPWGFQSIRCKFFKEGNKNNFPRNRANRPGEFAQFGCARSLFLRQQQEHDSKWPEKIDFTPLSSPTLPVPEPESRESESKKGQ